MIIEKTYFIWLMCVLIAYIGAIPLTILTEWLIRKLIELKERKRNADKRRK